MMMSMENTKVYGFIQFVMPMEKCLDKDDHVLIFVLMEMRLFSTNVFGA